MDSQSWSVKILLLSGIFCTAGASYGKVIGQFKLTSHGVSGTVYAANNVTIVISNFTFDGSSNVVILIGKTQVPASDGTEVPIVRLGRAMPGLGDYDNDLLVLTVPGYEPISAYRYIAVWNRQDQGESFGVVSIPESFVPPAPYSLGVLTGTAHDFYSSNVIILDAKTVRFVGLSYDGQGPATFFWAGNTTVPDENGTRLIWKDTASQQVERSFQLELIDVTLPVGMTVTNITHISMWCEKAVMSFGHILIPEDIASKNVPPATEMIRVYDNCEVLSMDEMQVRWSVKGGVIDVELGGKIAPGNFMGFGLSGSSSSSRLTNSDVTVTWMESRTRPMVVDCYYQQSQLQCSEGFGVCPDTMVKPTSGTDDSILIAHSTVGGVTRISYSRYLSTGDSIDAVIPTNTAVFIVWVIGPVRDGTVLFNRDQAKMSSSMQINFGRPARDACPAFLLPTDNSANVQPAWSTLTVSGTQQLRVDIGPSGGSRGYLGITGQPAWKDSFYVDGLLVPVIKMKRNTKYIINVFTGNDPTDPINYNPLYLTSSPTGGFDQLSHDERKNEVIYADKQAGPLCQYIDYDGSVAYNFNSFEEYKTHLRHTCSDSVIGGRLVWTPDSSTPDTVYYQSYTHFGLGFKIELSSSATDLTMSVNMVAVVFVAMLDY
ncbi:protein Skeletor, isoforms B/C-like [Asterias rubens]|uniref:protein Skeletor, isoforms B/C-like n=1 Tax=Asterias rubens TaxID=7604 RepID=UPI001455B3BB|nr:protein Skeletor, isoforms B/C-like [Asterias rubens]